MYTQSFWCWFFSDIYLEDITFLTSRSNSLLLRERESHASITAKFNFNGTVFTLERCQVVCLHSHNFIKRNQNYITYIV